MSTVKAWLTPISKEEREKIGINSLSRYTSQFGGVSWKGKVPQIRQNLMQVDNTATVEIKVYKGYPTLFFCTNKEIAIASSELITFRVKTVGENISKIEKKINKQEQDVKKLLNELPIKANAWRLSNKATSTSTINYNILDGVQLFEYQKEAIKHIVGNKQFLLSGEPGTGKTIISIASAMNICNPGDKVLVVVPNPGLVRQFSEDCQEYGIKTKIDWKKKTLSIFGNPKKEVVFHIVSLTSLKKMVKFAQTIRNGKLVESKDRVVPILNDEMSEVVKSNYKMVIVDESHTAKNEGNKRSPLLKGFLEIIKANGCERLLSMTGTPYVTRASDILGIYKHTISHPLSKITADEYNNIVTYQEDNVSGVDIMKNNIIGIGNYDIEKGSTFEVGTISCLYIPKERSEIEINFIPIEASSELINQIKKIIENERTFVVNNRLVKNTYMKMLCACAEYKSDTIIDMLKKEEEPVVMMSKFTHKILDDINKSELSYTCARYDGTVSQTKRKENLKEFIRGEKQIFVGEVTSSGTGINGLQWVSKKMYLSEIGFSIGLLKQIMARIDRIGKISDKCHYNIFYIKGFYLDGQYIDIEENIINSVGKNAKLLAQFFSSDENEELANTIENQTPLFKNKLRELLTKK